MNPLVPDFILKRDAEGQTSGTIDAVVLFVDISGFTSLTARLMQHGRGGREGAEALVRTLRFHFDPLVTAVHEAGGFITGFAGDAFTALFPVSNATALLSRASSAPPPPPGRARGGPLSASHPSIADAARNAADRMQRFFAEHPVYQTPYGDFPVSIRVGLSFGKVSFWIVHVTAEKAYYFFQGPAIDAAAAIEHSAASGQVLFDAALHDRLLSVDATSVGAGLFRSSPASAVNDLPLSEEMAPAPESGLFIARGITAVPPQGEFREVASVFAGFERVPDPPDLIQLLHGLSSRYGGTFTGLDSGDKGTNCLIHFGAPVSHENDTERALDFALELRRELGLTTHLRAGLTRGIRYVGFNGGARRMEFACLGRATNLAARLMMSAPWGDIYCGPEVVADAQAAYQMRDRGVLVLKGFEQPIGVASLSRKKQLSAQKEFTAKELIGRRPELARLEQVLEPVFGQGRGTAAETPAHFAGVIYVDGEAGLGKSYLVETYRRTLESRRDQPFLWIEAPCDQTLQTSLNAFESAFKQYCRIEDGSAREDTHARLDDALDRLVDRIPDRDTWLKRELDQARSVFGALIGLHWSGSLYERLDPKARFERTLVALFAWLRAESLQQPVVFHLEDAHWADDDTRRAIQAIARSAAAPGERQAPLAILCTSRYRDDGAPFRMDLDRAVPRAEIALGPLSSEEIGQIASNVMGRPLPDLFRTLLLDHAAGNPFFAEEIVSYWSDAESPSGSIDLSFTAPSVALLPSDVNTLLVARLDRLMPHLKLSVFAAAVLGVEFDLRILTVMLDAQPLDMAEHARAIERQRIWLPLSPIRYRFRNTLLRNAAYEIQARARLQRLHRKAAQAIEVVHADDIDGHLAELARHYRRADAPEQARHYLLRAARRSTSRYAHTQAKQLYRAYLKLVGDAPTQESVIVRYELARDVFEPSGALAKAWEEHGRVITDAQRLGSKASEALGWLGRGRVRWTARQLEEAVACLKHGLTLAREAAHRWTERRLLAQLALVYRTMERPQDALMLFDQTLRLARDLNEHNEATAFGEIVRRYLTDGRADAALALFEQSMVPAPKTE